MSQTELKNGEAILGGTRTSWDDIMAHVRAGGKIRRGMTNEDLIRQEDDHEPNNGTTGRHCTETVL